MMDLAQLQVAAQKCQTKMEALELVRRETAATMATFEGLSEDHARARTLSNIAYLTGNGMDRSESARIMDLFEVAHPYFGRDITKWPKTLEETILLGQNFGLKMRLGENPFHKVEETVR